MEVGESLKARIRAFRVGPIPDFAFASALRFAAGCSLQSHLPGTSRLPIAKRRDFQALAVRFAETSSPAFGEANL